jgi:hypothetical protein
LEDTEQREGKRGTEVKSNVTDNESAVIISAEAVGNANECEHLPVMLDDTLDNMREVAVKDPGGKKRTLLANKNYFSEENLRA